MRMCSDDAIGPVSPFTTWLGAGFGGDEWNDYWDGKCHLQDVLDNYNGSVYIVWGMQDWNVDPYHAFPTHELLHQQGINVQQLRVSGRTITTSRIDIQKLRVDMGQRPILT